MTIIANEFPKICFVKTAWSDEYQGQDVFGRHEYIRKYRDGHERYNFKPGPDGQYFGYVPPHKTPDDAKGWLIIFVAASTNDNGRTFGPILPVGWFEDANFVNEQERPEYGTNKSFPDCLDGTHYLYSVIAKRAFLIPTQLRNIPLPKQHGRKLGMTSKVDVKSSDPKTNIELWRLDYAQYAIDLLNKLRPNIDQFHDASGEMAIEGYTLAEDPTNRGYATSEHRRAVEISAEEHAKKRFRKQYHIRDVTKDNLGYDFHLIEKNGTRRILLEVKGTSGLKPMFYLTRNERKCLDSNRSIFHLFLVTNALSTDAKGELFCASEIESKFDFEPLSYHVTLKD